MDNIKIVLDLCEEIKRDLRIHKTENLPLLRHDLKRMVEYLSFGSDGHVFADWLENREELSDFIDRQLKELGDKS